MSVHTDISDVLPTDTQLLPPQPHPSEYYDNATSALGAVIVDKLPSHQQMQALQLKSISQSPVRIGNLTFDETRMAIDITDQAGRDPQLSLYAVIRSGFSDGHDPLIIIVVLIHELGRRNARALVLTDTVYTDGERLKSALEYAEHGEVDRLELNLWKLYAQHCQFANRVSF